MSERTAAHPDLPPHLLDAYRRLVAGTAEVLPAGGLASLLLEAEKDARPLRVKHGIDPSGTELTLGHAVVLRKLRQFQDLGHLVVLIVGDFTGMVGDPSGRSVTRRQLTVAQARDNAADYVDQLMRVLDPDKVELRYNSDWLGPMTMADVVRETSVLTVAQMLERDDFATRFAAHQPISLPELLYPFLMGYDSVAVHADIELGGTDQTYNLMVGRDLQRAHSQHPQVVLTVPLLEGLDGVAKMSKSLGNYVALTEPAAEQFGKLMSIPDTLVTRYATLCTDLGPDVVAGLEAQLASGGAAANAAKRRVATEIVALYHGAGAAAAAQQEFNRRFRDRAVPEDVADFPLTSGDPVHLPALLRDARLVDSTSAARRAIAAGSVRLAGHPMPADTVDVAREVLAGKVIAVGRRRAVRLV